MDAQLTSNDDGFYPGKISACFARELGDATVSFVDLAETVEALVGELRTALLKRDAEIAELRGKVAALEARGGLKYVGVFREGRTYEPDQFATHGGAIWHCNARTTMAPGNGAAAWTLACKAGRDGRDAKGAT